MINDGLGPASSPEEEASRAAALAWNERKPEQKIIDVDCDEIRRIKARLKEINAIPFEDIRWMHQGQPVTVNEKEKEEWPFWGFNNADFVTYVIDKDQNS